MRIEEGLRPRIDPRETVNFFLPLTLSVLLYFQTLTLTYFNSNKRIRLSRVNQNSPLSNYKNTNLILQTTERMIYKVLSLYCLHLFPPLAAVSLLG